MQPSSLNFSASSEPNTEQVHSASSPSFPAQSANPVKAVNADTSAIDTTPPPSNASPSFGSIPKSPQPPSNPIHQESTVDSDSSSAASSSPSSISNNSVDDTSQRSNSPSSDNPHETPSASALPRHIRFPSTPPPSSSFTSLLMNQLGNSRSPNSSKPGPPFQIPYRSLPLDLSTSPNSFALLDKTDEKNFEDADDSLSDGSGDGEYPTNVTDGYNDPNISDDDFSLSKVVVKGQHQQSSKGSKKGKNKRKGKKNKL